MPPADEINLKRSYSRFIIIAGAIFFVAILIVYKLLISAPADFPQGRYIDIQKGLSIEEAGQYLKDKKIIRSVPVFKIFVYIFGSTKNIIAGEYRFDVAQDLFNIVANVTDTSYKGRAIKITIPEGFTNRDIADLIDGKLPQFNRDNFLQTALPLEGELFPDTYIFPIAYDGKNIITKLHDNFQAKIADIKPEIIASKYTRKQIVIMASILEKEARTTITRKIISGILWKRFDAGMLLQVDSSFLYLLNKTSAQLTGADLNIDSPYNTYKYKGLPPGAISNPGLDALDAALHPTASPYYYYLSDSNGTMHYAVTFDQHKKNKLLYLTNN